MMIIFVFFLFMSWTVDKITIPIVQNFLLSLLKSHEYLHCAGTITFIFKDMKCSNITHYFYLSLSQIIKQIFDLIEQTVLCTLFAVVM